MPATPTIAVNSEDANGIIAISWTNADSPGIVRVKRSSPRETNGAFITLTEGAIPNAEYLDANVRSNEVYSYQIEVEESGIAVSAIATGSISITFPWLHAVTKRSGTMNFIPGTLIQLKTQPPHARQVQYENESLALAGATDEELFVSPFKDHQINLDGIVSVGDTSSRMALQKLFHSRATICLRDGLGNKWFCSLPEYMESYSYNTSVPLTLFEDSFTEVAA